MRPRLLLAMFAISALLAAGCGGDSEESGSAETSAPQTSTQSAPSSEESKGGEASIEEFGSEAEGPDREEILSAFEGYLNALGEEDYATACSHLSAVVRESLEQIAGEAPKLDECAVILPALLSPSAAAISRQQANGEVTRVRVEGDRAFVVFEAPGAESYQLTMVSEDGEWKSATVTSSVLVPEL